MRISLKIIKYIMFAVMLFILAIAIYLFYQKQTNPHEMTKVFGYSYATISTDSMEPTIMIGDFLVYKKEKIYSINDIVVYMHGDISITHRIVGIENDLYITKGDNNDIVDEVSLDNSDIIGKVIYQNSDLSILLVRAISLCVFIFGIVIALDILVSKKVTNDKKSI